ncbi:MAG: Gfo/Idh/MocA family oxidoreductase [Planctomycetes bacterium]|nr:Gfo/Idh/MocA family oxidoreductase [Planctomycetota bacterium]
MSGSGVLRVGLVGCGGMGRTHIRTLQGLRGFKVVGLCDIAQAAADRAGQDFGVSARFTDFEKMLDAVELDLVVVATHPRWHRAPTVAAARRRIHVLCEKPMALDLAEADEMVEAARESGVRLAIHQQNHVNPGIRKAQAMVAEGRIGEVLLVRGRNKAGRRSGNEVVEMGTHVADMMMCFGGIPRWVAATVLSEGRFGTRADVMDALEMSPKDHDSGWVMGTRAVAAYGFDRGILGEVHFLGYAQMMRPNYGVDVLGTEGQLAVRAAAGVVEGSNLWHLPRPMEGTPSQASDWRSVDLSDMGVENPIVTMYRRMSEAIKSGNEPPSSGIEGRWALEMMLGIYESHRQDGRRIPLPLADRQHPLERWRQP